MDKQKILDNFDNGLKEKYLPTLQKVLTLCKQSIANFHKVITLIAQEAIKELLQSNNLDYETALKQEIMHIAFPLLIARFNSVLPLDYPFIVAMVQEENRLGLCLKAVSRKDIPGMHEATNPSIIPFIVIDTMLPGPILHLKSKSIRYLNREHEDETLPQDQTT